VLPVYLVAGLRTPFTRVDGALASRDAIELGVPVVQAMAAQVKGRIDIGFWGTVIPSLRWSNIARETWLDAGLDATVPTSSVVMACSTSMMAAFDAAGVIGRGAAELALAGGTESMTHVQLGITQGLSDVIRRVAQGKNATSRWEAARSIRRTDLALHIQEIKNRTTGKSMGQHSEETAQAWGITRAEQDARALASHVAAAAAQARGFFDDLIVPVDGVAKDAFPRGDSSIDKLAKLRPVFDTSERGTHTAGNSSPLTDGAAAVRARLPQARSRVKLVDMMPCAVDIRHEGLLMAPAYGIPQLLSRNGLRYDDIQLWELHEAFAGQVEYHLKALDSAEFVREKAGVSTALGVVPRDRLNPNGGSVALGHPFAATGARILSQAVKELASRGAGARAIVSICADGGVGTVALLEV
jgi:acetyl-CoA C-acetyltransferase